MNNGKLYINKEEYSFEVLKEGIRLYNDKEDKFIPNQDMFSIRYISLYNFELYIYIFISLLAFGLWWVVGLILSLYTFAQYYMNKRIVLITNRGQIVISFKESSDKFVFIKNYKEIYPEAFKFKKWFQFRKEL